MAGHSQPILDLLALSSIYLASAYVIIVAYLALNVHTLDALTLNVLLLLF
jgi:hypothetical protein